MDLPDGYLDLRPGKLANVVTNLEMFERPPIREDPTGVRATLRRVEKPDIHWYRALFHKVGDGYLWSSRLVLDDDALRAILDNPLVEAYAVDCDGEEEGMLELDFRVPGECEIAYFALTEKLVGSGTGRWLMNQALAIAWGRPLRRMWLHTCTLDHPSAVAFYVRSGFRPFKRQIEILDDPRMTGVVPAGMAPHVPML